MEGNYPVFVEDKIVGDMQVRKQGMFYLLQCDCHLPEKTASQVFAEWDTHQLPLGMLVPEEDKYVFIKHVHTGKFMNTKPKFCIRACNISNENGIVLETHTKIPYLSKLEAAYLWTDGSDYRIQFKTLFN